MNDEEYLKLFGQKPLRNNQYENLNETKQNQQWKNLNETPDLSQYNINENVNDGWGNIDIQIETRVNGVEQQQQQYGNQLRPNSRRHRNNGQDLNGLDAFIDDEPLREVVKAPIVEQIVSQNIQDVDMVSIEMFESMNSNALLSFVNNNLNDVDTSRMTNNNQPTTVNFLKS